jgi:hypothetical protein
LYRGVLALGPGCSNSSSVEDLQVFQSVLVGLQAVAVRYGSESLELAAARQGLAALLPTLLAHLDTQYEGRAVSQVSSLMLLHLMRATSRGWESGYQRGCRCGDSGLQVLGSRTAWRGYRCWESGLQVLGIRTAWRGYRCWESGLQVVGLRTAGAGILVCSSTACPKASYSVCQN